MAAVRSARPLPKLARLHRSIDGAQRSAKVSPGWETASYFAHNAATRRTFTNQAHESRPEHRFSVISSIASVTGSLNRRGPALPGLRIEHAVNRLDPCPVRVAGNDHVHSAGLRIEVEVMNIVQDVDGAAAEADRPGVGIARRAVGGVHITPDRDHGGDPAEVRDDLGPADVAGVDDMGDAGQALLRLGTQQAVRVRK